MRRDIEHRACIVVLGIKGIEFLRGRDLADRGGDGGRVAQNCALDLVAVNELLDQHLGIPAERLGQAGDQAGKIIRAGDAHRRAGRAGLDKHRINTMQLIRRCAGCGLGVLLVVRAQYDGIGRLAHAGRVHDDLGQALIHRAGRRRDARADKGDTRQGQQALDGAVLAAKAVQHREAHVHTDGAAARKRQEPVRLAVGRQRHAAQAGLALPRAVFHLVRIGVFIQEPAAVARNADRHEVIFALVGVFQDRGGRQAGNAVFVRQAAE